MKSMKTTNLQKNILVTVLLSICAFSWAQSSPVESADAYGSVDLTPKTTQKKERTFSSIMLGDTPIELGNGSIFEYNMFNTDVVQSDVAYMYYPKDDAIVLVLLSTMSKYYILFDQNDRAVCRNAYKQYLADFDARVLDKKSNKTYNLYGEFAGEYRQGMIGTATITKPKVSVGYRFVKNSPYFTLTLWPAELESFMPGADVEAGGGSDKMTFFMTKKQAASLINLMDEASIDKLLADTNKQTLESVDSY